MINSIGKILKKLLTLLPRFDVSKYINSVEKVLAPYAGYINWFIPVSDMYDVLVLWSKCITAYFVFITIKPLVMRIITKSIERGVK